MSDEIRVGMIGLSEGNGHPFSFSAIINGFSDEGLAESGWPVIYNYVRKRDPSEFGVSGMRITHAWTQVPEVTRKLCRACLIPEAVDSPGDFMGQVDAVIVARDDFETHQAMAMPFLEAGLPVFVDKPLSLNVAELKAFRPYLDSGLLMSCSGMRYAAELDNPRAFLAEYGNLKLIRGAVLNSWEKYGVHLLDAVFNLVNSSPVSVMALEADHTSVAIAMDDGLLVQLDALGETVKTFKLDIWGTRHASSHEVADNFTMFRRTLWHFAQCIRGRKPVIPPRRTLDVMRTLMAGLISRSELRKVFLDEIQV